METNNPNPKPHVTQRALKLVNLGLSLEEFFDTHDPLNVCNSLNDVMQVFYENQDYYASQEQVSHLHYMMSVFLDLIRFYTAYESGECNLDHLQHIVFSDKEKIKPEDIKAIQNAFKEIGSYSIAQA